MKRMCGVLFPILLVLSFPVTAFAAGGSLSGGVRAIDKFGNLDLDFTLDELQDNGFSFGDVLEVAIDGDSYAAPLCSNYSDVEMGENVLRANDEKVELAINAGDFAASNGIADREQNEDGTVHWIVEGGRELADIPVSLSMKEAGGYYQQYLTHQLVRTDQREDYSSDAVFANFRNVAAGDLGENALFRSSSPVDYEIGRAAYADALARDNGIRTILNLADSKEELEAALSADDGTSPYYKSLYEEGNVLPLSLNLDFTSQEFNNSLAEGLRFMAEREGPYLVHCLEGKDRGGFVSALLASYMGASYEELVSDYMASYENYYHIQKGSPEYTAVKESNIDPILRWIAGVGKDADLTAVDFRSAAEAYIEKMGLNADEREALRADLGRNYREPVRTDEVRNPSDVYIVAVGDSLWSIARRFYGDGTAWHNIYSANRPLIRNANRIFAGQRLVLP